MMQSNLIIRDAMNNSKDYYLERADRDIEKYRKGDFKIIVKADGCLCEDAEVQYKLQKIDFDFGCNIFMLDQYEDPDRQEVYLNQWKKIFNTATIPLYWEGTEPEQGKLRYSKDTDIDMYRRPAADRVVEYCKENNIKMKGHPLFWHEFIPSWLPKNWNDLLPLIEKRFQEISERYAGDIEEFDCVNEPGRIWDMCHEHRTDGYVMVAPPNGYLEQVFELGKKYFPNNRLIINEAVGSALCEFKGIYGSYFQLLERLISEGLKIDKIGLQCHCCDDKYFENIFDARRLYGVLDGYAMLGKSMVVSEIGLACEDPDLQAEATEQLYKICFSIDKMSGIFWWNLDDDGILTTKNRNGANGENLPTAGLCRNGKEKPVYKVLNHLINEEWTTNGKDIIKNGSCEFRGFYGEYEIHVTRGGETKTYFANFAKGENKEITLEW